MEYLFHLSRLLQHALDWTEILSHEPPPLPTPTPSKHAVMQHEFLSVPQSNQVAVHLILLAICMHTLSTLLYFLVLYCAMLLKWLSFSCFKYKAVTLICH